MDHPRPAVMRYAGDQVQGCLSVSWGRTLEALSGSGTATSFLAVLTLVRVLLYRYTGQSDLVIGTPVAGREHPDLEGQIGFYVNTLALRTQVEATGGFGEALEKVRADMLEGYAHQVYPYDRLVDELQTGRDLSRSALFDILVVMQD